MSTRAPITATLMVVFSSALAGCITVHSDGLDAEHPVKVFETDLPEDPNTPLPDILKKTETPEMPETSEIPATPARSDAKITRIYQCNATAKPALGMRYHRHASLVRKSDGNETLRMWETLNQWGRKSPVVEEFQIMGYPTYPLNTMVAIEAMGNYCNHGHVPYEADKWLFYRGFNFNKDI